MSERKQEILEVVARLLEQQPQSKITTALIAKTINLSEAALYRHYPSRRRIFIAVLERIEELLIPRIHTLYNSDLSCLQQSQQVIQLLLAFVENNKGFAQLLVGAGLDDAQITNASQQVILKITTIIKQQLRDATLSGKMRLHAGVDVITALMINQAQGLLIQFIRDQYKSQPSALWLRQWQLLEPALVER